MTSSVLNPIVCVHINGILKTLQFGCFIKKVGCCITTAGCVLKSIGCCISYVGWCLKNVGC